MKKKIQLFFLTLISAFSLMLMHSNARAGSSADCSWGPGDNPMQCAYVTLIGDLGRYIRVIVDDKPDATHSFTECVGDSDVGVWYPEDVLDPEFSEFLTPNVQHSETFYICPAKNSPTTACTWVGKNNYVISRSGNTYVAQPKYYEVNLVPFQNQFPPCNPFYEDYRNKRSKQPTPSHFRTKASTSTPAQK